MDRGSEHAGRNGLRGEPDALDLWFNRQRRKWWRSQWWLIPGVFVMSLVTLTLWPMGFMSYVTYRSGPAFSSIGALIPYALLMPFFWMLIVLSAVIAYALFGRQLSIPAELQLATSRADCHRAFVKVLRWDAYLVFGMSLMLPLVLLSIGLWSTSNPEFVSGLLYSVGPPMLLIETAVWLHANRRDLRLAVHIAVPVGILLVHYYLFPKLLDDMTRALGYAMTDSSTLSIWALGPYGALCVVLALFIVRANRHPPKDRDVWLDAQSTHKI